MKIAYFSAFMLSFASANLIAMEGFENPGVLEALGRKAEESRVPVSALIEAAQNKIGDDDMVRFYVTVEGELFLLDGQHRLFAFLPISLLNGRSRVLVASSDANALQIRSEGILYYTEDLFGDDAKEDRFIFVTADNPIETLNELVFEYDELHPKQKVHKRARK